MHQPERDRERSRERDPKEALLQKYKEEGAQVARQQRLRRQIYIKDLPKRPARQSGNNGYIQEARPLTLLTNNFLISFKTLPELFIYAIKFTPLIPWQFLVDFHADSENRELVKTLVTAAGSQIRASLGSYVASGSVLFSLCGSVDSFEASVSYSGVVYTVGVRRVKAINMGQLNDPDPRINFLPLNWFNILVRDLLKSLKFFEYGRTRKFYVMEFIMWRSLKDSNDRAAISETKLDVLKGFATSFHVNESGLNLQIDLCYKLVRQETLLQVIKQVYHDNAHFNKDEKRDLVRQELVGCQIIANYGNFRAYAIDDVLFDKDTSTFEVQISRNGEEEYVTLDNYFLKRYNITIRDKRAPIVINKSNNKMLYFVPELCIMAGVPKNFNEFMRKKVSQHCCGDPEKRLREITALNRKMLKGEQSRLIVLQFVRSSQLSAEVIKQEFGIQISDQPLQVTAKHLSPPTILFGKNTSTREIFNGSFNSGKNPVFNQNGKVSYAIIHTLEFQIREVEKVCPLSIYLHIGHGGVHRWVRATAGEGNQGIQARGEQAPSPERNRGFACEQDLWAILDRDNHRRQQPQKELQADQADLANQGRRSIAGGVPGHTLQARHQGHLQQGHPANLLQDRKDSLGCAKTQDQNFYSHVMLASAVISSQSIVGMCATLDQDFTQFYNQAAPLQKKDKRQSLTIIGKFLREAYNGYQAINGCPPIGLIYFREGLDDESVQDLLQQEVPQIKDALGNTRVMIVTLQRSQNTKVFLNNNGRIVNPPFGTVIDSDIVTKNYEFLMIAQHASRGTVSPTLYRVIYDQIQMPAEMLEVKWNYIDCGGKQDLIYSQCYNYQNWTGAIKVPAIIQNATRLAKFIGESLGKNACSGLQDKLFYL